MNKILQFITFEALVIIAVFIIHLFTGATGWSLALASFIGGLLFFTSGMIFTVILEED